MSHEPPSLDEFSKRLDAMRGGQAEDAQTAAARANSAQSDGAEMGKGLRLASELIAAVLVGVGAGWGLDLWFGWTPWATIAGLGFGFAAGALTVYRTMNAMDETEVKDATRRDTPRRESSEASPKGGA